MTKQKLPTSWRDRPLDKWNASTFRQYLSDMHTDRYGIAYTARNYGMEAKLIRTMIDDHGAEITKSFIDTCFSEYRPTPQYPSLNFAFMYSYMRERILPKLMAEQARHERMEQEQANEMSIDEINEWL